MDHQTTPNEINPTRSAPLCVDCAHFKTAESVWPTAPAYCNHPGTPRNPETGKPLAEARYMRMRYQDSVLADFKSAHCGLSAELFEALPSAVDTDGGQPAGDVVQAMPDSSNLVAERVLKHNSELLAGASTDESPHQLRVGSSVSLPELRID